MEKVATPHASTLEELTNFLKIPASRTAKALFMMASVSENDVDVSKFVIAIVRGDTDLNETKLANAIKAKNLVPALEDEKKQVLVDFNRMETGYPKDKVLHQLFGEQAAQTPDQIALIGAHESRFEGTRGLAPLSEPVSITYKELNKKSNQLAAVL
jgi:prolyl-tRNA synthetase